MRLRTPDGSRTGAARKLEAEAQRLRAAVEAKVLARAALNPSRADLVERFQKLLDDFSAGSANVEAFFQQLNEEERRSLAEGLDEEQLGIYDLLMRPAPPLADAEECEAKKVARSLLEVLKREKLVLDWRKEQRTRAAVQVAVAELIVMLRKARPLVQLAPRESVEREVREMDAALEAILR